MRVLRSRSPTIASKSGRGCAETLVHEKRPGIWRLIVRLPGRLLPRPFPSRKHAYLHLTTLAALRCLTRSGSRSCALARSPLGDAATSARRPMRADARHGRFPGRLRDCRRGRRDRPSRRRAFGSNARVMRLLRAVDCKKCLTGVDHMAMMKASAQTTPARFGDREKSGGRTALSGFFTSRAWLPLWAGRVGRPKGLPVPDSGSPTRYGPPTPFGDGARNTNRSQELHHAHKHSSAAPRRE